MMRFINILAAVCLKQGCSFAVAE